MEIYKFRNLDDGEKNYPHKTGAFTIEYTLKNFKRFYNQFYAAENIVAKTFLENKNKFEEMEYREARFVHNTLLKLTNNDFVIISNKPKTRKNE